MNTEKIEKYLDGLQQRGIPGCDIAVYREHKLIWRYQTGEGLPGRPMAGNENYWFYSASKVICMTAMMQLIEQGKVKLTDKVSQYLPEYAHLSVQDGDTVRPAKTVLTIEQLMSMTGGLDYDVFAPNIKACTEKYGKGATTRQIVASFVEKPLSFDPGTHMQYSLCHDVIAAVIEVVAGMTYGEYLEKNVFGPAGAKNITFHPTEEQLKNTAALYSGDGEPFGVVHAVDNVARPVFCLSDAYESGGAGLYGDLDSYAAVADALANGGVAANGNRLLDAASIEMMRVNRLHGDSQADFDSWGRTGYSYALGVRTLVDDSHSKSPIGEFGWDSAAGAYVMIDPSHALCAVYCQHVLACPDVYTVVHPQIRDLIYECLIED